MAVALVACSTEANKAGRDFRQASLDKLPGAQNTNPGAIKWKADLTTKMNVGLMLKVMTERRYLDVSERKNLSSALSSRIDVLVKECRMQGPDHEALHKWLENVIDKMKHLEKGTGYKKSVEELRGQIESFYFLFE